MKKHEAFPVYVKVAFAGAITWSALVFLVIGVEGNDIHAAATLSLLGIAIIAVASVVGVSVDLRAAKKDSDQLVAQIVSTLSSQEFVDQELGRLAESFEQLRRTQVRLHQAHWERDLATVTLTLRTAMSTFWDARRLAKDLGFEVRPTMDAYLVDHGEVEAASPVDDAGAFAAENA